MGPAVLVLHYDRDSKPVHVLGEIPKSHSTPAALITAYRPDTADAWGPYLSLEEAYLLDDIRELLKQGDIARAAQKARVYTLTPVATNR